MINEKYEFTRQPRFLPEMPGGELEIPDPPRAYEKPEISWFTLLAPPVVMLVITLLLALTSQSMFMMLSMAMTVMTLVVSLASATSQIKKYKDKKKEREKKYLQFIVDCRSGLTLAREQQVRAMNEMNPEPASCLQRIRQLDNRLWERTPSYPDFLSLRVGVGSVPAALRINYAKQAVMMESDPLLMEPHRLAMEFDRVQEVPVAVNLLDSEICGIAGDKESAYAVVTQMLLQLVTHHGYDDVRVVVLTSEEAALRWNWLKVLPHMWSDGFDSRYLLCGKAITHPILGELYAIIKDRELKTVGGGILPHYVFIVEDPSLLENEPINKYLYNKSGFLGVSAVFIAQNQAYLPMNCKQVVMLQGKIGELTGRETGEKSAFVPDKADLRQLEQAARKLAPLRIKNTAAQFSLPSALTLMEMLRAKTADDVDLLSRWERNKPFKGMSVPIGVKAGGSLFHLDMHETGHGPHGLVAGTTGSGKSELLQSIIVSLAINYHPHDVSFVLIDYKGGGMADIFRGMPHLVGTITNLGGNQTTRALLSIKSELMRRQRVFSEYGVNNIDRYQKLYYSHHSRQEADRMPAVPHLVMIADEFAELKQDQPDFMKELVSTARVGRSLGVHLILATQKPAGVVDDQIWSNSKFKICLKVQDETDSQDVIKRPDAAMIKEPGRAYIQVGNDEIFELFQSAYSGADYDPEGEMQKRENRVKRIYEISLHGRAEQIYPLEEEKIAKKELPTQLKAMVRHIISLSGQSGIKPLKGPWMPPLPETVFLDDIHGPESGFHEEYGRWTASGDILSVPIGLLDDPRNQRQEPLVLDFASDGNLFVYGSPGTGKTYLLRTLCMSLAHKYSPADAHLYIMDFGGASFKVLERLPHCGGVMTLEQESRIQQFVLFLFRIMEERKRVFEDSRSDGFNDFRKDGGSGLPAIVLVIDNYFALSETYEQIDEKMVMLAREGSKYGIYMVVSATNASLVRYKFAVNFKVAVTLQLTDKGEYDSIVGRTEGLEPAKVAGRALVRGKPPLEFQTAVPEFRGLDTEPILGRFEAFVQSGVIPVATPIPVMPAKIDLAEINREGSQLAIGLGDQDLQPVYVDLAATPVLMIAGDPLAGKSTQLVSWIGALNEKWGAERFDVYALDSSAMGLYSMMQYSNVTDLSQIEDMYSFVESIKEELDGRRSKLLETRKAGGDVNAITRSWKQIIFVIDKLSELTESDLYSLKELLERIVKQERGMKVAVLAADLTAELANNWDSLGKAIREEQCGLLLGSLKEQNLFNARLPYGTQEKELEPGDGYFIVKNKFTGLRTAVYTNKSEMVTERR
ncbi:type VII secretion protein EssC [Paenibacillus caui]|uniref:type VII secretion protein EssC n=1 Tax=Paenibacillus caui TaxID=2873927 RepID=UPI001CA93CB2|nr:type VII secretion protein EssC [Paenibacillus caui]